MKKLIILFFVLLTVFLAVVTPVLGQVNQSSDGDEYKVQRDGNNITLTSNKPKIPRAAGIPELVGTINGTTFTGKQYLVADDCPNLDGYVPASGTITADGSVTVTYKTSQYYYETCVVKPDSESEVTKTYSLASAANTSPTPSSIVAPTDNNCWSKHMISQMAVCSKTHSQCTNTCTPLESSARIPCFNACSKALTTCYDQASADYRACIAAANQKQQNTSRPTGESDNSAEKPSVGVSSNDFKALARANAEFQKAQAELEEIKKANDSRYEAKKDFPAEYKAVFQGNEKLKEDLEFLRADLETVHELVSKYKDFSEIEETVESIKKGGIGEYGKSDFFTDAVKSFNDYHDLRNDGVSAKDATTKATLDNFGTSALTLVPVLKAIDLIATTPDFILGIFGVNENNWSRKYVTDGFIGKFAPSGVVEQTTDLMIQDNWSDIGNALKFGWNKVVAAEGWADTVWESEKLAAAAVGAVPVAIAQGISDIVGGGLAVGEKVSNFVSSWFTSPN